MNQHVSRPERDALLPFVEARLRELTFLAARIHHEPAMPTAAIEQASHLPIETMATSRNICWHCRQMPALRHGGQQ